MDGVQHPGTGWALGRTGASARCSLSMKPGRHPQPLGIRHHTGGTTLSPSPVLPHCSPSEASTHADTGLWEASCPVQRLGDRISLLRAARGDEQQALQMRALGTLRSREAACGISSC